MKHHLDPMEQSWNGIIIIIDLPEAKKKEKRNERKNKNNRTTMDF